MRVTLDDEIGLGGKRAGEHVIVLGIGANNRRDNCRHYDARYLEIALEKNFWRACACDHGGRELLAREDIGKFGEQPWI